MADETKPTTTKRTRRGKAKQEATASETATTETATAVMPTVAPEDPQPATVPAVVQTDTLTQPEINAVSNDTALAQMAGIDRKKPNAVDYANYLKPGDIAESNALILFKYNGVDSKDISPEMFNSRHPDLMGNYHTYVFPKPGITLMSLYLWRYFEAEIIPNLQYDPEIAILGTDQTFTKLPRDQQELIVYHLWDPNMLNAIAGSEACGHLRKMVADRFKRIDNPDATTALQPKDINYSKPTYKPGKFQPV